MVLRWKVVIFLTFLIGLSAVLLSACDRVGENYVLEDGETLDGGQHVVAVEARLESGSVIRGDLNITASDVEINSHIEGDLTVVASNLELGEDARIEGNLIYCLVRNGKFSRNENAVIWGDQRDSCSEEHPEVTIRGGAGSSSTLVKLGSNTLLSLLAGLLATLITMMFPYQLKRINLTAWNHRLSAVGLGFLTIIVAIGLTSLWRLSLALIIPAIFAPVIVIAWFLLVVLTLAGMISIAEPFGRWLLRRFHRSDQIPAIAAMIGAGSLTFLLMGFRLIPGLDIITPLLILGLASWTLGAALMTRAGTRHYQTVPRQLATV